MPRRPKRHQEKPQESQPAIPLADLGNRAAWLLLGLGCLLFVMLTVTSLRHKSVTIDEFGHLPAGYNLLCTGNLKYCEFNPPLLKVLSALPFWLSDRSDGAVAEPPDPNQRYSFWVNGYPFMKRHRDQYHEIFVGARVVTVVLAAALGLLAFIWVRTLVPTRPNAAGVAAGVLIWFSPEVLAHGRLVTTDVGAVVFILLALMTLHGYLRSPGWLRCVAAGVALGLAQLAKFTAVYLYPIYLVLAAIWLWKRPKPVRKRIAGGLALLFVVSLLVLNAGYLFQGSGRTLGRHEFQSGRLHGLQTSLPNWLPVPLPSQYVRGFDRQLVDAESDEPAFLFGETYTGGRWYYFIALLAIKWPIPVLLLGGLAASCVARRAFAPFTRGDKGGSPLMRDDAVAVHMLLLAPAGAILLTSSVFSHHQVGLRLILPAGVLGLVWIAVVLGNALRTRRMILMAVALLAWAVVDSVRMHPDYLAYFNQLVGGPKNGSRYALDANLDWGQDLPKLQRFMEEKGLESIQLLYYGRVEPGVYGIRYEVPRRGIRPGYLAVSATLYGRAYLLNDHGSLYASQPLPQFRTMFGKPVTSLGHSIDIYEINPPPSPVGKRPAPSATGGATTGASVRNRAFVANNPTTKDTKNTKAKGNDGV